ncbi:MAG: tRNA 2-thiouridine(34) synthase MnmA [Candidatus Delongbacteria bacterium]|nr:tRNA 2-thiouridine(34) synthase MnmA [Candidatus Delongbacteria bacterium]
MRDTAVLLSGGVDSSVALRLLQRAGGHRLTAWYLKIWLQEELAFLGDCPWEDDLDAARAVCQQAGVPLEVLPLQKEYWERVVSYVLDELRAGGTPSPDLLCNERIKFGAFLDCLGQPEALVASGHYARLDHEGDRLRLLRSPDPVKDQSYFLARMAPAQLARCLFPVGHLHKHEVRALAEEFQLPNRARPDSQGICFLGKIRYSEFVRHHLGVKEGPIVEWETGTRKGTHQGFWYHTIGQRKGLRLHGGPWYVVGKDPVENVVFISRQEYLMDHAASRFRAGQAQWLGPVPGEESLHCKVRHGPSLPACRLRPLADEGWLVELERPDTGLAPGQFVVFYRGEECLGSAVIQQVETPGLSD